MYDVYFSYFDGNDHLCTNIDKIEIPTSSGIRNIFSGDEIASQHFRIHSEIYLYSSQYKLHNFYNWVKSHRNQERNNLSILEPLY